MKADCHADVSLSDELCVEFRVARIEPQAGRALKFCRCRYDDKIVDPDSANDIRTDLEVAATEHEALCSDRANDQMSVCVTFQ